MDQATLEKARQMQAALGNGQQELFSKADGGSPLNERSNPASRPGRTSAERQRIPMSVPVQKLMVPEIPGYHLHWFRGTPDRLGRALQAGYSFVTRDEVQINNLNIGDDSAEAGSNSLGDRVTVGAGSEVTTDNQPMQLVLMKIPLEFWQEDQRFLEDRNEEIANAIRGGRIGAGRAGGETAGDQAQRYIPQYARQDAQNLFTRKPQR